MESPFAWKPKLEERLPFSILPLNEIYRVPDVARGGVLYGATFPQEGSRMRIENSIQASE